MASADPTEHGWRRRNFLWAALNGALFEFGASFADTGTVVATFLGRLTPAPMAVGADRAVWLARSPALRRELRPGTPVPEGDLPRRRLGAGRLSRRPGGGAAVAKQPASRARRRARGFLRAVDAVLLCRRPRRRRLQRRHCAHHRFRIAQPAPGDAALRRGHAGRRRRTSDPSDPERLTGAVAAAVRLIFGAGAIVLALSTLCFAAIREPPAPVAVGARACPPSCATGWKWSDLIGGFVSSSMPSGWAGSRGWSCLSRSSRRGRWAGCPSLRSAPWSPRRPWEGSR